MSQVPVKWVEMDVVLEATEKQHYAPSRQERMIPVVPLSELWEVLEGIKEQEAFDYTPDAKEAEYRNGYNDAVTDIQRLFASLREIK